MKRVQTIDFGVHPFFVGVRASDEFNSIPSQLPFGIFIDEVNGLPTLELTEQINSALSTAYNQGSMLSTPLGIGRLGASRMEEFIAEFSKYIGDLKGKRVLEIGCGEGHMLAKLREMGAYVVGLEIGPQGKEGGKKYGIEVIDMPLEQVSFVEPFDAIISYGCLEHIIGITSFVDKCRDVLANNGVMFHSVPNTDNTISQLRFDDLCHQHVNYFTPENATRFFLSRGFYNAECKLTNAGNEMYMMSHQGNSFSEISSSIDNNQIDIETNKWINFSKLLRERNIMFTSVLAKLVDDGGVGLYGGGHVISQMSGLGQSVNYYDSDPLKAGKSWLVGLSPIRSASSLTYDSIKHLIICADHHMEAITKYLKKEINIPEHIQLHAFSELFVSDFQGPSKEV